MSKAKALIEDVINEFDAFDARRYYDMAKAFRVASSNIQQNRLDFSFRSKSDAEKFYTAVSSLVIPHDHYLEKVSREDKGMYVVVLGKPADRALLSTWRIES